VRTRAGVGAARLLTHGQDGESKGTGISLGAGEGSPPQKRGCSGAWLGPGRGAALRRLAPAAGGRSAAGEGGSSGSRASRRSMNAQASCPTPATKATQRAAYWRASPACRDASAAACRPAAGGAGGRCRARRARWQSSARAATARSSASSEPRTGERSARSAAAPAAAGSDTAAASAQRVAQHGAELGVHSSDPAERHGNRIRGRLCGPVAAGRAQQGPAATAGARLHRRRRPAAAAAAARPPPPPAPSRRSRPARDRLARVLAVDARQQLPAGGARAGPVARRCRADTRRSAGGRQARKGRGAAATCRVRGRGWRGGRAEGRYRRAPSLPSATSRTSSSGARSSKGMRPPAAPPAAAAAAAAAGAGVGSALPLGRAGVAPAAGCCCWRRGLQAACDDELVGPRALPCEAAGSNESPCRRRVPPPPHARTLTWRTMVCSSSPSSSESLAEGAEPSRALVSSISAMPSLRASDGAGAAEAPAPSSARDGVRREGRRRGGCASGDGGGLGDEGVVG